jgi:hypothetical protein
LQPLYSFIADNLAILAKDQFASRVVERALVVMPFDTFVVLCYNFIDAKGKRTRLFRELLID